MQDSKMIFSSKQIVKVHDSTTFQQADDKPDYC